MGIQQKTQKQKESLNKHMKNIDRNNNSTEDSAPNSSIKFNLDFQWPADCLYLTFKIWICRQIYLFIFYYLIIWFFWAKILTGNKFELNRRFNKRFNPGPKPAFFFLPMFSRFPIFSAKWAFYSPFSGVVVSYLNIFEYISYPSMISFNKCDLFSI